MPRIPLSHGRLVLLIVFSSLVVVVTSSAFLQARKRLAHAVEDGTDSRLLLEDISATVAQIRVDYVFTDFGNLTAPTPEVYQSLACQTDAYMTNTLQQALQVAIRLSIHVTEWSYDPDREAPLTMTFQVEAFYDDPYIHDSVVAASDVVKILEDAKFEKYLDEYAWLAHPIRSVETEVIQAANALSYAAQVVSAGQETTLLYDTQDCPIQSEVNTTWYFGFAQLGNNIRRVDVEALACQIRDFLDVALSKGNFDTPIEASVHDLSWTYNETADPKNPFVVTMDVTAIVKYHNGETSEMSTTDISLLLKDRADLVEFIRTYVFQTNASTSVFENVQGVRVDSMVQDVTVPDKPWNSDSACPRPTKTPSPDQSHSNTTTVTTTIAPTTPVSQPSTSNSGINDTASTLSAAEQPSQSTQEFVEWCLMSLFAADEDRNGLLSQEEYVLFLNTVASNTFEGYPYVALPLNLQNNYDTWALSETGEISLEDDTLSSPPKMQRSMTGNIFLRGGRNNELRQSSSSTAASASTATANRDQLCASTQDALAQATKQEQPSPVRLTVQSSFLAYNQLGMKTAEDFWGNDTDLTPAFRVFLQDYVMDAMDAIILRPTKRQWLRNLASDSANRSYWILPETADVGKQVKETSCPADTPSNASCLISSSQYEVFILTDNPGDKALSKTYMDAALQATNSGIENGSLQAALDKFNPQSPWTLLASGETAEDDATPLPEASPSMTLVPSNVSDLTPADVAVANPEDDSIVGDGSEVIFTASSGKNQCGGEFGQQALGAINTDCDSFVGKNFWHIVVIVCLVVFLFILFLPICIWGRYPCLCQKAPKSNAKMVRGNPSHDMDIETRNSLTDSDNSRLRDPAADSAPKRRGMFRSKSWSNDRTTVPPSHESGRSQERLDELRRGRARPGFRDTTDLPRPTRRPPRRSRSDAGEYHYSELGPGQPQSSPPLGSQSDHRRGPANGRPQPRRGVPRRSKSDSGDQQRFGTTPPQPRPLFPLRKGSDAGDGQQQSSPQHPPQPRRRVPLRSKSADSGCPPQSEETAAQPRRRAPLRSKSFDSSQERQQAPPLPRRRIPIRSNSGDGQRSVETPPPQNPARPCRRVPMRTKSDSGDRPGFAAAEQSRPRPTRRTPRRAQSVG